MVVVLSMLAPADAGAQPLDPYGAPPPPPPRDEVGAAVAVALLDRARELAAAGELEGARQLAGAATARDPDGATGQAARALAADLDRQLGRGATPAPAPPVEPSRPYLPPPPPPPTTIEQPAPAPSRPSGQRAMAMYGAIGGAALGLGLAGTDEDAAAGAIGGAAVGGLTGYYLARRADWTPRRAHLAGSGVLWGAAAGALFADVVTGRDGTTEDDIAAGAGLGALAGGVVGVVASADDSLTLDDAALIHSMTALGLLGGLTTAVAIDPPENEAYSMNAALGIAGGYVIGHLAARRVEISSRRLLRIDALAVLGAAVPLLIWRATDDSESILDDGPDSARAWGLLATAGLVGGAYLGLRWTRGMDRNRTPASTAAAAAPPALLMRGSQGWTGGGLALAPVRHGRGAALTLLGGTW